jgi:hypothetical protein
MAYPSSEKPVFPPHGRNASFVLRLNELAGEIMGHLPPDERVPNDAGSATRQCVSTICCRA